MDSGQVSDACPAVTFELFFKVDRDPIGVILTLAYEFDEGCWQAHCVELGTATYGDSYDEVRVAIKALVVDVLNTLEDANERASVFDREGIEIVPIPEHVRQSLLRAQVRKTTDQIVPLWLPNYSNQPVALTA